MAHERIHPKQVTATHRLYWNAARTKLVPDGAEAAFLAYRVGDKIPDAIAAAHGLIPVAAAHPSSDPQPEPIEHLRDRKHKGGRRRSE